MKYQVKLISLALLALTVSGCTYWSMEPDFGQAVNNNTQMQVVDYTAGTEVEPVGTLDGVKAKQVMDGYHREAGTAPTGTIINIR